MPWAHFFEANIINHAGARGWVHLAGPELFRGGHEAGVCLSATWKGGCRFRARGIQEAQQVRSRQLNGEGEPALCHRADQVEARPGLRHALGPCAQHLPVNLVSPTLQDIYDVGTQLLEPGISVHGEV